MTETPIYDELIAKARGDGRTLPRTPPVIVHPISQMVLDAYLRDPVYLDRHTPARDPLAGTRAYGLSTTSGFYRKPYPQYPPFDPTDD